MNWQPIETAPRDKRVILSNGQWVSVGWWSTSVFLPATHRDGDMTPQTTPPQQFAWLLIRTEQAKEQYVERQIANMGFQSWCPVELITYRTIARGRARLTKERPVLPKRLLAAVPVALHGDLLRIRYLTAIECDGASAVIQIPHSQVMAFRETIDRMNRDTLALIQMGRTRKQKAQWRDMKSALEDMIRQAGEQLQEVA